MKSRLLCIVFLLVTFMAGKAVAIPLIIEFSYKVSSYSDLQESEYYSDMAAQFPLGSTISGSIQVDSDDILNSLVDTYPATGNVTAEGSS